MKQNQDNKPKKRNNSSLTVGQTYLPSPKELDTSLRNNSKHTNQVVDDNNICHMLTCCKEHYAAVHKQGNLWIERWKKCTNPYLLILRQPLLLSPWLRRCLDLLCDVQVLMLKMFSLHLIFTSFHHQYNIQRPQNLARPTPLAFIFTPFFFSICIYDPNFYLSEAMIIPGCCSQSLLCSHWNSVATGWGRVAHSLSSGLIASVVLWMLWGTAGLICLPQ